MDDEIKKYYDTSAQMIADEWYGNNILLPTIKDFLSLLPQKPKVLDLGCGPGYESMRIESLGAEVVGIDFSPENVRIARERCPQCTFYEMDFRVLDDRLGIFDGMFSSASLIHITPIELPNIARKLTEILRTNGILLTLVQDGNGTRERYFEVQGKQMHWWITLYSKEKLRDLLRPFVFLREGILDHELLAQGWRCYLWQLKKMTNA